MSAYNPRLRASAAHRWMNCPASVKYRDSGAHGYPAAKGTLTHQIAAEALHEGTSPSELDAWYDSMGDKPVLVDGIPVPVSETREAVFRYLAFVRGIIDDAREQGFNVNMRVELSVHRELALVDHQMGGTIDCLIWWNEGELIRVRVIDLKAGYQDVAADANMQLRTYTLGALLYINAKGKPVDIEGIIFQPHGVSGEVVDRDTPSYDDIKAHGYDLQRAAERTRLPRPVYKAGTWCNWCPHAASCRELKKSVGAVVKTGFNLPEDRRKLGELAAQLPMVKAMVKAVEQEMTRVIIDEGQDVPGFKRVINRSSRQWSDIEKAKETLRDLGDDLYQIVSPAKVEAILGKKPARKLFDEHGLVEVKRGNETWAPVTDKRDEARALTVATTSDFED